ncbi:hypothetical protein [Citromicrobium sp. JLT1363]|uniref:hypothetical protein n=1 Tax=Citromicrobium sp. JLT1363 TaxID=517722 RepID=UPI0002EDA861|nr:hypothetical protein [Citromicrobium sp. JLT1363]
MKRLLVVISMPLAACNGSNYEVAADLTDDELRAIVPDCGLASDDFTFKNGTLIISKDADFEKSSCVMHRVKALGKYSGAEVGNAKYVTPSGE